MKSHIYSSILLILTILLTTSFSFNIVFYNRISQLDTKILHTTSPVSQEKMEEFKKEINRLSNIQYDTKTKQPICNDLFDTKK